MKTLRLLSLFALITASLTLPSGAQMYSPRRLTQRIAPQVPPPPTYQTAPAPGMAPVVHTTVAPLAPAKSLATAPKDGSAEATEKAADDAVPVPQPPPLTIECKPVAPNPLESLQYISLTLSNTCAKAVSHVNMHLLYFDAYNKKLKEWTTRRELDPVLTAGSNMELDQPAYFMPWLTKHVKVELGGARFSDGTEWSPGTTTLASH